MNNLIAAQEELQNKRNIWALAVIEDVLVPGRASHQRFLAAAMAMNAALRAEKAIYDNLLGTVEPRDIPRPPDDWYNDAFDNAYRTIGQDRLTQAVYSKVAMISNNLASQRAVGNRLQLDNNDLGGLLGYKRTSKGSRLRYKRPSKGSRLRYKRTRKGARPKKIKRRGTRRMR